MEKIIAQFVITNMKLGTLYRVIRHLDNRPSQMLLFEKRTIAYRGISWANSCVANNPFWGDPKKGALTAPL